MSIENVLRKGIITEENYIGLQEQFSKKKRYNVLAHQFFDFMLVRNDTSYSHPP